MTDSEFQGMIENVLVRGGVQPWELGDFLGVSARTITRWAAGYDLPHTSLRVPIQASIQIFSEGRQ